MRTPTRTLASLASAVFLAGCTLAPKFERPPAPVSENFPTGGVYDANAAASSPAAAASSAPPSRSAQGRAAVDIGWRDFFIDPRLQALVALALDNNRDLRVSMLNVEAARAQYQITHASIFPSVSGAASVTRGRTPADLSTTGVTVGAEYSVGLNLSWELDLFGRIRSLSDEALAQYFSLAETRKAAEIALVSQVAIQYLTLLADDDQLTVTRNTLKTAEESYRITKLSFDTGVGTELDERQSEGILDQAGANLQAQSRTRAQDENALVLLVGQPLPADLPQGSPLDAQNLLSDIPAGLPSDLIARRPDIAAAEQTLRAANANIGAARAAFFPSISLTGSYGSLSPTFGGLFKTGSSAWSFLPEITVPIFSGGANTANLDLAQVQKRIEIANYEKTIQTAFREVADGLAARGTFDSQIGLLERNQRSQQRRLELSDSLYRNGVNDYLSVLQAQTDLYTAQQTLVSARLQRATNLVSLYKALGGGWLEHDGDAPRAADIAGPAGLFAVPSEGGSAQ